MFKFFMLGDFRLVFLLLRFSFFFFKQKPAYEMRISDWSSDVCSSDLPTFLLTPGQHRAVAEAASRSAEIGQEVCTPDGERPEITLALEHEMAMEAIARAQDARDRIVGQVLTHAAANWPDRWHELRPLPFRFASWVGYDMDGRTDIKWYDSIRFRLAEKAQRQIGRAHV